MASAATISPEGLFYGLDIDDVRFSDALARRRLEPVLARLGETDEADWSLVKRNVSRSVYRYSPGDGGEVLYLKHFHSRSLPHRIEQLVGISDARCEMRFSEYLSGCDVPVPRVLARFRRNGTEWLISDGITPAVPADKWHMEQLSAGNDAAIRSATIALAEIVGRMHACGVIHRDLHCGNVLVRTDNGLGRAKSRQPALVLMDLHRMRRRRRLSRPSRAANLAQLFHDRRLWSTRSQRVRFLRQYMLSSGAEGTLRGWVRQVEMLGRRHCRRLNAQRDRRIFGTNRYFSRLAAGGWRGRVVLASKRSVPGSEACDHTFTADDWRGALAEPEALLSGPDARVVKDSPSSYVVRRWLPIGGRELDVYVKRPRRKRTIRWLIDVFRHSRPLRAFYLGHALLARHIHTALPLAAMEKRRCGFLLDSILITEAVPGLNLHKFLNRHLGSDRPGGAGESSPGTPEPPASRKHRLGRQVLWQLGLLLRRLHQANFAHRDLKASNLLVHWDGLPNHRPDVVLVDLDGVRRVRRVTTRQQFRGLMRLNVSLLECPAVSHAGRLRMLLGYLRRPGSGRINFKPYWRFLQDWSSRKIRRQIASRQRRQKAQRLSASAGQAGRNGP